MSPKPFSAHTFPANSKWMIPALILLLITVIVSMVIVNHHRTQNYMVRILQEKGQILTRALEAGTRTGMMGRMGESAQLQTLFQETTALPGIRYILLSDPEGVIHVNADPEGLAERNLSPQILDELPTKAPDGWMISGEGKDRHFLFYQSFTLLRTPMQSSHGMGHRGANRSYRRTPFYENLFDAESPPLTLTVGMDIQAFDAARAQYIRQTLTIAGVLLLLAIVAVIALFRAEALRHSRMRLRDTEAMATEIIRSFPAGLLVLDARGQLRFANKTAEVLLGKPLRNLVGQVLLPHLPEVLKPLIENPEKEIPESEIHLPGPKKPIPISVSLSPIQTEEEILGRVLVLRDLSEIRRLEEEVRRKEKLAAVGQLAAGVAHEIRNPLSSIKGFATHFRQLFSPESDHHEAADILIREVNRMDRVIGELLEFARPSDIQPVPTLPEPLIHHTLRLIAADAKAAEVTIKTDVPALPEISMDPDRITQVLLNLYLNAIQAMEKGGTLTVTAKTEEDFLSLWVQDTGKGIPPEKLPNIFDPFYTTRNKGTGLGLAVVEKIVTSHGGQIRVESPLEGGTRFSLSFPL